MEYVIVKFPTRRRVYIDAKKGGYTNRLLRINPPGVRVFSLGNKPNFRPASHTVMVKDTTVLAPLELKFHRKSP